MIIIINLCLETEELCMDDLVESYYICNDSENESPALIAEETVNSSKIYTYLKHNIEE